MYDFETIPERRGSGSVKWGPDPRAAGRVTDEQVLPYWVADMDFPLPPEIHAEILARAAHRVFGYAALPDAWADSFIRWTQERHGVGIGRYWTRFSPGVVPAIAACIAACTSPGEGVLVQPPVYHPFAAIVRASGRRLVENPLLRDADGRCRMDFDALERVSADAKLLVLCSPHNPVGRVWTRDELERLADIAERRGLAVVSDEIHSDIVFPPNRHVPALALPESFSRRSVSCYAPSKTWNLAGLQASCIVIPDPVMRASFDRAMEAFGLGVPNVFAPVAVDAAYRLGGPWLAEALVVLSDNRARLERELRLAAPGGTPPGGTPPGIAFTPTEGSYLAWMDFSALGLGPGTPPADWLQRNAGVRLDEGTKFGSGGEGFARFNFACPPSLIDEAVSRIADALRNRARSCS
ncbi:MAG: pyridoxal phosphate-dependent aminotransferase [Spirochaetes bacterium]|nr:pyridoxal phosphate-dependent aminotransferase [Spirochaetota bacterium]